MAEKMANFQTRDAFDINYSTSERRIGTWMGEPLYQKTFNCGTLPNTATTVTINETVNNVKDIVNIFGIAIEHTTPGLISSNLPLPHISTSGNNVMLYAAALSDTLRIVLGTTADRSIYTAYVTVQYTKTT